MFKTINEGESNYSSSQIVQGHGILLSHELTLIKEMVEKVQG